MIPGLAFHFDLDGIEETLRFSESRVDNLAPPLRQWAKEIRAEAKAKIAAGDDMPPLAASTLLRREQDLAQTSRFTAGGAERTSYLRRLEREGKRMEGLKRWGQKRFLGLGRFALPERVQQKVERYEERVAAHKRVVAVHQEARQLVRQIEGASRVARGGGRQRVDHADQEALRKLMLDAERGMARGAKPAQLLKHKQALADFTGYLQRKYTGEDTGGHGASEALAQAAEGRRTKRSARARQRQGARPLLGKTPGTLFSRVFSSGPEWMAYVGSRWPNASKAHNEGATVGHGAPLPRRQYLKLTRKHIDRANWLLTKWGLAPLQGDA